MLDNGYPSGWEGELVRKTLERLQFGVRQSMTDQWAASMSTVELQMWREEMVARMAYALNVEVLAERLEPDVQRVWFTRPVEVTDHTVNAYRMPASWWDHWKLQHPTARRRLRLKPVRWVRSGFGLRKVRREVDVEVCEDVTIERFFTFPNSTLTYPRDLGSPVYYERRAR